MFFHFTFLFCEKKLYGITEQEGLVLSHSAFYRLYAGEIFQAIFISRIIFWLKIFKCASVHLQSLLCTWVFQKSELGLVIWATWAKLGWSYLIWYLLHLKRMRKECWSGLLLPVRDNYFSASNVMQCIFVHHYSRHKEQLAACLQTPESIHESWHVPTDAAHLLCGSSIHSHSSGLAQWQMDSWKEGKEDGRMDGQEGRPLEY